MAVVVSISRSKSLASRRLRPSQAKVRSITQRRGSRWKPSASRGPLDDLELQSLARGGAHGDVALVAGIGEQMLAARGNVDGSGRRPVPGRRGPGCWRMDDQPQRQAQRVGEQMPLAAVDLLAGVEAARAAGLGRLDALAVDDRGGRRRLTAGLLARRHEQGGLDRRPDAVLPESPEIAVDRAPRRELARQHAPWAAGAEQVQQRVQHLAQRRPTPPTAALGRPAARARSARTPRR